MKRKKNIIVIIIALFLSFPFYQVFMIFKMGGNLIIHISNQSDIDTVNIELFLNNKKEVEDYYTNNEFHNYKRYVFKTKPKSQSLVIKTKDGITKHSFSVNTFFIKWISIDYSEIINEKGERKYFFVERQHFKPPFIN